MTPDEPQEAFPEQPFLTHLIELRSRLLHCLWAVGILLIPLTIFANRLFSILAAPMLAQLPIGNSLIATQVVTPFLTPFKLAAVTAVFLAMPYLLWQAWSFVAPGLYQHEKRFAYPMLVMSIVLFYAGIAFAYFVALPITFGFITRTAPQGVAVMTDIASYLDFTLTVFFAFGLAFQIPVLTILLAWAGITTPQAMARARPYVLVGAFTMGMLLTPPDVFSQTLLALPTYLLYELGILLARVMVPGARAVDAQRQNSKTS
jgi:sec-independent protein translocase protein TatC